MARRGRPSGQRKTGGRKAGTPNKIPRNVKESILAVHEIIGGDPAFAKWARKNRGEFYTKILPRVLPKEITGEIGVGVRLLIVEEIVDGKYADGGPDRLPANGQAHPQAGGV